MKQVMNPSTFTLQAFSSRQVIFDDSDLVSMNATCRIDDELVSTTLLFTFNKFNDLLRFSDSTGAALEHEVCNKLWGNQPKPYIIDASTNPYVFSSCELLVSYLIAGDTTCLSVEQVHPLSFVQQVKNLRANKRDFNKAKLCHNQEINNTLDEIGAMYKYYKGLLELNVSEDVARQKSGLTNEKLFKLASNAYSCVAKEIKPL